MTSEEKIKIQKMRFDDKSYTEIAQALKLSKNTVKSFCRRIENKNHENYLCKNCKSKLEIIEKCKLKMFCCDNCRITFWRKNKKRRGVNAVKTGAIRT